MEKNSNGKTIPAIEKGKTSPEEINKSLQAQIEKFQKLQKIIFDRETFLKKKNALGGYLDELKKENKENKDLESNVCKIVFQDSHSYKGDNVLTISNSFIIERFITFVTAEIDVKVNELEKQIVM